MKHRLRMAGIALHISTVLYVLIALALVVIYFYIPNVRVNDPIAYDLFVFLTPICIAMAIGVEFVAWGIRHRKYWAWVAGLCIFATYIPSLFLPLGVFGMWGLLDSGSRCAYGFGQVST